jgi:hypothetical protein
MFKLIFGMHESSFHTATQSKQVNRKIFTVLLNSIQNTIFISSCFEPHPILDAKYDVWD